MVFFRRVAGEKTAAAGVRITPVNEARLFQVGVKKDESCAGVFTGVGLR